MTFKLHLSMTLTAVLLAACGGGNTPQPDTPPTYSYFAEGNPAQVVDVPQPSEPSTVIMGGGPDVGSAFKWMIERSGVRPGSGGRFVIIRASGTEAYNP